MFDLMSIIVPIIFIIVIGIIVFSLGQGIVTWNKNNQSPRSTVSAVIIAKREILHIINMQMQGMRVEHTDSILQQTQCIM